MPVIALVLVCSLRLFLACITLHLGFMEYDADGFTRVIHSYEWLQHPRWEVGVWLPLQFWIVGGLLAVWNNIYDAPKLLNTIAGLVTIVNIYVITRTLSRQRAAVIAAFLAAIFPFEVWFSVSGMSEPLFHAFLTAAVAGFVRWWQSNRLVPLAVASAMMCAATAIRYEGWFYAAVMLAIVCITAWHRRQHSLTAALVAAGSFLFAIIWIEQSMAVLGSPFAFASETSAIKAKAGPENATAGILQRFASFSSAALRVDRTLIILGVLLTLWLVWRQRQRWAGYVVLVGGQAFLLSAVSAGFASLGPGSERYLLSNTLLLIPPSAAAIAVMSRKKGLRQILSLALMGLLLVSFVHQLQSPPRAYPDEDVRSVGRIISEQLDAATSQGGLTVTVLLPGLPSDAYNAGYALRVLSGHPHDVHITDQPSQLQQDVDTGVSHLWVLDSDTHVHLPQAARTIRIGRFVIGWPPSLPHIIVTPSPSASNIFLAHITNLVPDEEVHAWLTAPDGNVLALPNTQADVTGNATLSFRLSLKISGQWALSVSGKDTQAKGIALFQVTER